MRVLSLEVGKSVIFLVGRAGVQPRPAVGGFAEALRLSADRPRPAAGDREGGAVAAKKPKWWVYVLRCADGTLYTGVTTDVPRRVGQHNAGTAAKYTRSRGPVELVHTEPAKGRGPALRREAAIKKLPRADKLRLVSAQAA